jgi:hypothetical protein
MMVFDYLPRGEYMLGATVTRTSGTDGIQFAITVDGAFAPWRLLRR